MLGERALPGSGIAAIGVYAISEGHEVHSYVSWSDYQAALNERLNDGARVVFVIARGQYDSTNLVLSARQVVAQVTR